MIAGGPNSQKVDFLSNEIHIKDVIFLFVPCNDATRFSFHPIKNICAYTYFRKQKIRQFGFPSRKVSNNSANDKPSEALECAAKHRYHENKTCQSSNTKENNFETEYKSFRRSHPVENVKEKNRANIYFGIKRIDCQRRSLEQRPPELNIRYGGFPTADQPTLDLWKYFFRC